MKKLPGLLMGTAGLMLWVLQSVRAIAWAWMGVEGHDWWAAGLVVLPVPLIFIGSFLLLWAEEDEL